MGGDGVAVIYMMVKYDVVMVKPVISNVVVVAACPW